MVLQTLNGPVAEEGGVFWLLHRKQQVIHAALNVCPILANTELPQLRDGRGEWDILVPTGDASNVDAVDNIDSERLACYTYDLHGVGVSS